MAGRVLFLSPRAPLLKSNSQHQRYCFPKPNRLTCSAAIFLTSGLLGGERLAGGAEEECGVTVELG